MSVLCFERVGYRFPGRQTPALTDVSLALETGEFCVLAGLTGSGKSTLLRAASGLVPHFHGGEFSGRVRVAGLDTREHGPGDLAAVAGTVLQDPETQVVMGTVAAELAFPLENRGERPAAVARGVEEVALALGIEGLLGRSTHELSGGELQRVGLAAALVARPQLVLLDEPTSQLDPVAGDELIWLLRRLNQEWGTTVLLVEHRLERCLAAADRAIGLVAGRIACDADPAGFLRWAADHAQQLLTPAARLIDAAGLEPTATGVKQARATLRASGLLEVELDERDEHTPMPVPAKRRLGGRWPGRRAGEPAPAALSLRGLWHELRSGPAILRGADLELAPGELVALMGRNGAGKSTLLRHAAGLLEPTRGRVSAAGQVDLLLQNPGDYFLHERVADELDPAALAEAGLGELADRHPADLSGGERQRLALAIVAPYEHGPSGVQPALLALDEPTRGMDRGAKDALGARLCRLAAEGPAVLVATHDVEFAASFARRVVLMADGRVIADGAAEEVLSGGWYFSTETARILDGAGGALLPAAGAALLRRRAAALAMRGRVAL